MTSAPRRASRRSRSAPGSPPARGGGRASCQDAGMPAPHFDLIVRGGTVVSQGRQQIADVAVRDGQIAQLGGAMTGTDEVDARGLLVIPGGIDAHVHLLCARLAALVDSSDPAWCDDFWSGSQAAIAGGITTVGNMT